VDAGRESPPVTALPQAGGPRQTTPAPVPGPASATGPGSVTGPGSTTRPVPTTRPASATGPGSLEPGGGEPADPDAPGRVGGLQFDRHGLLPAVVQDARDGRVLMVGFVNAAALSRTLAEGRVVFYSRSRRRLWRKGETSGNELRLVSLAADCDGDALLLQVIPAGPTCHRGTRSCFDPPPNAAEELGAAPPDARGEDAGRAPGTARAFQGFAWLEVLWATIEDRGRRRPAGSYTAHLLAGGIDRPARKVAEEATEVLLAALGSGATETATTRSATDDPLAAEAADLLYHLLVLLHARGVEPAEVLGVLRRRHRPSPGARGPSGRREDAADPEALLADPEDDPLPRYRRR
jgi:phosphoribosyl-ATP pyrophosphohydrolase/phosphoribosyl-AMP cyclohydrolase